MGKLLVEGGGVVSQETAMRSNEVLGEGPIEAFDVRIHLGGTRIRVEVRDAEEDAGFLKALGELAAVVRLELVDEERADLDEFLEKVSGIR